MAEDEVILIMNFVDGSNLDRMLFGKKEYREVSEVNSPQKLGHVTSKLHETSNLLQFTAEQVAFITTKIAAAIQYMHHHNPVVIHQDIKPQNVLVSLASTAATAA